MATQLHTQEAVYAELWTSLASLLRSYTAAHGIHSGRHATVEMIDEKISARHGKKWLILVRKNTLVTWTRENGSSGSMVLTDHGCLRSPECEEAMDMTAETWARDLMRNDAMEQTR